MQGCVPYLTFQNPMSTSKIDQSLVFVRKWGTAVVTIIAVFGGMWAMFAYTVRSEIQSATRQMSNDISAMKPQVDGFDNRLVKVNDRIDTLLKEAMARAWPKTVDKSNIHSQLQQASGLLKLARHNDVKVDPEHVQRLGLDVLELVNLKRPEISLQDWKLVNDLLSYYSLVNPIDPRFVDELEKHVWTVRGADRSQPCITAAKGAHDYVYRDVEMQNCTLRLTKTLAQALTFQNAIFREVTFIYEGGAVVLDNVAFIDCTFQLSLTAPSKRFGETLLAENQIYHLDLP